MNFSKPLRFNFYKSGILPFQVQNQISQLKSSRGKSKENKESKRVKAAEEKLTDLITKRKKVEINVKNIIDGVKTLNPEINIIDECMEMRAVMNLIAPDLPLPKQPPQTSNNQQSSSSSSNHVLQHQQNIPKPVPVRATLQNTAFVPPPPTSQQTQQAANIQQQNVSQVVIQPKGNEEDPAKRMVTIRRVNLPHAEPQVTVTAKGTTPDKDQLLYTFVNGQLVPASSLHPQAIQNNSNGSLQIYMSNNDSDGHDKATIVEQKQQLQVVENNKQNGKNGNKKEQQLSKKQLNEKVIEKSKENKIKSEKVVDRKKEQQQQVPPVALTTSNSQTSIKKTSKDSKNSKKKQESSVKKENDNSKLSHTQVDEQQAKKKIRKVYIDPEFAANPFKLLLDDDDEEEEFTTETDEDDSNHDDEEANSVIEKMSNMEISSKNTKKSKDEPKNVKKQAQNQQQQQLSQQNVKNDKNLQKKQQVQQQHVVNQKGKIIERQDSVTSATSSNNSKDSKQLNKNNNKKQKNVNEPQKSASSFVQSFPLHPQYQPTIYKPTDYVKKPTISAQPSHQSSNSIMDQLNRGVRVEGLRLPPGITLTKVAPTNEAIATKRDSINRVSNLKLISLVICFLCMIFVDS